MKMRKQGANILLTWNVRDEREVEIAKETFLTFTKQGWLATMRTAKNEFQRVFTFPPQTGKLLFIPFSEGG